MLAFVAGPFQIVFAQEASTSIIDTSSSAESATPAPSSGSELDLFNAIIEQSQTDPAQSEVAPAQTSDAIPPGGQSESLLSGSDEPSPTLPNSNLFTAQSSAPKVDKLTGALVQRIPLDIPPGRGGLTPDVTLVYNSQELKDGIVGYGWSLSIPYIERINKTGVDRLYTDNYFRSSMSGELATTSTANEYRARIEDGSFLSYTFASSTWTVYDKNGTRYLFGTTTAAQQYATTTPTQISKWFLEEVRDRNDNYIEYTYTSDGNEVYPSQIIYTGKGTTDGPFTIDFTKSARPDVISHYDNGYRVTTAYRITEIKASINSSWVRKYTLSYGSGVNGYRSILTSVQQSGRDESAGELTLPALTFTYSSSTPTYSDHTNRQIYNSARVPADVDGNGLPDFSVFYQDPTTLDVEHTIDINTYPTFTNHTAADVDYWSVDIGGVSTYRPLERGVRFFDVNGDGKAEIVKGVRNSNGTFTRAWWENQSNFVWTGRDYATSSIPMFGYLYIAGESDGAYSTGLFGNVNGDGLTDYVISMSSLSTPYDANGSYLHAATSTGWALATSTYTPVTTLPISASPNTSQLLDINGDGLDDWMAASATQTIFCLNLGTNWQTNCDNGWKISTSTLHANGWDRGIRFIDMNGDGLLDYVRAYHMPSYSSNSAAHIEIGDFRYIYLNTGSGWAAATSSLSTPGDVFSGHVSGTLWAGEYENNEYVDWNGDGYPDFSSKTSSGQKADLLAKITYPTGGSVEATYAYSSQSGDNPNLAFPVLVVTSLVTNDNNGNTTTVNYRYEGGKMYFGTDIGDRRFAGFNTITEFGPARTTQTYFNQGDSVTTSTGEQTDGFAHIGRVYREDMLSTATSTFTRTYTKWDTYDQGSGRTFIYKARELSQDYDGGANHKDRATEFTFSTTTGALTQKVEKGEVTGSSDGTYTDVTGDTRTTEWTYATSTTITNLLVPISEVVKNNGGTRVKESLHTYDNLSSGTASLGNKTKEENWITGSTYASSTYAYTTYGLVASTTDPRGYVTAFEYDTNNLYVATSTNPLSQVTTFAYNLANGKVATTTDPNSTTRVSNYDPVGRLKEVKIPDPTSGMVVTQLVVAYTDNVFPSKRQETRYLNSATSTDIYTYFDGLGRPIQERTEVHNGNYIAKDKIYNSSGLLYRDSLPYFSSTTPWTTATTTSSLLVTYTYDALERITGIQNVKGTESRAYDRWQETVTDRNGRNKDFIHDAFRNLTQVNEYNATTTYATAYTYDALGNLTRITDALSNLRNFTYDGLSRLTGSEDLHVSGDGTFGSYSFTYDAAGNLTSRVDPKSQTVNWTYDGVNRPLTEDYTGAAGTEISYAYDTCTNGKGRLCIATSTDAVSTTAYNPAGLASSQTNQINGTNYVTSYSYDRQGNYTDITYPDNSIVRYGYSDAGLLQTITRKPGNSTTYYSAIKTQDYSPANTANFIRYGNEVENTNTYDATELYRLKNVQTVASSTWSGSGSLGFNTGGKASRTLAQAPRYQLAQAIIGEAAPVASTSPKVVDVFPEFEAKSIPNLYPGLLVLERATQKGQEIASIGSTTPITRKEYTVQVIAMEPIEGGVTAFIKAWRPNGEQIGFGSDGTVDVERIRIFNPPILAVDPKGDIIQTWKDKETGIVGERRLRKDPKEAFLQVLDHVLAVMQTKHDASRIVPGKVGQTTSTFYPAAGKNSPVDGGVHRQNVAESWSTVRTTGGNAANDDSDGPGNWNMAQIYDGAGGGWNAISRSIYGFNTSAIGDTDTITAATFSIWGTTATDGYSGAQVMVDRNAPQSASQLSTSDYNLSRWDSTEQATNRVSIGSWNTSGYNDFTLNSTGRGNISKTGNSWYGLRHSFDFSNSEPTGIGANSRVIGHTADASGTTNDPVLVVEHETPASPSPTTIQSIAYTYDAIGNITGITDASDTQANKTLAFTYDSLHRLLSASTTAATSTSFREEYSYNAIGNLTNKVNGSIPTSSGNASSTDLENASSQYWSIADASQTGLDFSDAFTLSLWFKLESLPSTSSSPGEYYFVSKWSDPSDLSYRLLYQSSDTLSRFYFSTSPDGSNPYNIIANQQISTGTWYHLAAKKSGTAVEMFLNGVSIGSSNSFQTAVYNSAAAVGIGGSATVGKTDGLMDDVRFWNRALTSTEISNLYSDAPTFYNGSNLQSWWKFEGNGNDTSGIGNTLTGQNSPTFSSDVPYTAPEGGSSTTYLYAGTGYYNPHAPTSFYNGSATTTYAYDNNGNATSAGSWTYTYNYKNQLISAGNGTATTTYGYDHLGNRVFKGTGSATTTYPFRFYDLLTTTGTTTATSTAYLYSGPSLFATVTGNGLSTTTSYIHPDHLGGTNVVTNASGTIVHTLDYYPYGAARINNQTGTIDTRKKYIGIERDTDTGLDYAQARYYENARGQFLSQDPVFWEVGQTRDGKSVLANPQAQNSYGYAGGNPIIQKDPSGRYLEFALSAAANNRQFSIGFRGDAAGIDFFTSGGFSVGAGGGLSLAWAPGQKLTHAREATISARVHLTVPGTFVGGGASLNAIEYNASTREAQYGQAAGAIMFGIGNSASIEEDVSMPVIVWGTRQGASLNGRSVDKANLAPQNSGRFAPGTVSFSTVPFSNAVTSLLSSFKPTNGAQRSAVQGALRELNKLK